MSEGRREDEREWGRLADAASEGPWMLTRYSGGGSFNAPPRVYAGTDMEYGEPHSIPSRFNHDNDTAFIAAARTAVPELLVRLQAARAENQRLREELGRWKEAAALQYGAGFEEARTRVWSGASMLRVNIQRGYYKDRTAEQPIIDLQTRIEEMEAPRPAAGEEKGVR